MRTAIKMLLILALVVSPAAVQSAGQEKPKEKEKPAAKTSGTATGQTTGQVKGKVAGKAEGTASATVVDATNLEDLARDLSLMEIDRAMAITRQSLTLDGLRLAELEREIAAAVSSGISTQVLAIEELRAAMPDGVVSAYSVSPDDIRAGLASVGVSASYELDRELALAGMHSYAQEPDSQSRELEQQQREREQQDRLREREFSYYERGHEALNELKWDKAAGYFNKAAEMKGNRADACLYWQAYAHYKQGQQSEATTLLQQMLANYPNSRWKNDARALEIEVKKSEGRPVSPDTEADCDLKLLAINALAEMDAARAIPQLEKVLMDTKCPKNKSRALFVMARSKSPEAQRSLLSIAKGEKGNPDLQLTAVRYLGLYGGKESVDALATVYSATSDVDVKRQVLGSYRRAKAVDRLFAAARNESNTDLRYEAVQQLGYLKAATELDQLYAQESSVEIKDRIVRSLYSARASDSLTRIAQNEANETLRRRAIYYLGHLKEKEATGTLLSLYEKNQDEQTRKTIIDALYRSGDAPTLIGVARKESNPELKKYAVARISRMKDSPEAVEFMLEILNQ